MKIIVIPRITSAFRLLACSLLICAAVVHSPITSFAQTADSSGERTQNAEPRSGTLGFSDEAREINNNRTRKRKPQVRDAVSANFFLRRGVKLHNLATDESCSPKRCSSEQFEMGTSHLGSNRCHDRKGRPAC